MFAVKVKSPRGKILQLLFKDMGREELGQAAGGTTMVLCSCSECTECTGQ